MPYVSRHLTEIEQCVLRPADFSLSAEQAALCDVMRTFLSKHCPSERVRAAEPLGWDADLWDEIADLRLVAMGLPESKGGTAPAWSRWCSSPRSSDVPPHPSR